MIRKIRLKITFKTLRAVLLVIGLTTCYIALCTRPRELNTIRSGKFHSPSVDKRNIFFIETSCMYQESKLTRSIQLHARQACAIESTARTNPQALIYLLHTCPLDEQHLITSEEFVKELFSHPNVFGFHVDVAWFLEDTPLHGWYPSTRFYSTEYLTHEDTDVLRLATLWKFGGICLDLDFVVFKSLSVLGINFAGFESTYSVRTSALSIEAGHDLAEIWMMVLQKRYDGGYLEMDDNVHQPTQVLLEYCHAKMVKDLTPENCNGFKLYPRKHFYPVKREDFQDLFTKNGFIALNMTKLDEKSYMVKVWSSESKQKTIDGRRTQGYGLLAEIYCPTSKRLAGLYF